MRKLYVYTALFAGLIASGTALGFAMPDHGKQANAAPAVTASCCPGGDCCADGACCGVAAAKKAACCPAGDCCPDGACCGLGAKNAVK